MNNNMLHKEPLFLVIDNGTQSIRALLFDLQGQLIAKSQVSLQAYVSPKPGWAEQQPDYFWQNVVQACQQLWQQQAVIKQQLKQRIVSISITTQRGSVVNLDKQGKPLRSAILWLDQRLGKTQKLPWYWRIIFRVIGQHKIINYFGKKAQANWLAQHQPEIWAKTDKFLLLSGYLHYQLTGEFTDSRANIVGYLPFDYKKQDWAAPHDWKWQALPIKREQLPELVSPGETLGYLTEQAAKALDLPKGLAVIASASDKACEVLGSGCFEPTTASLSYGTTATINTNNSSYVEPTAFIPPYASAIPNQYNSEIMIFRGFWMVNWFKQQFGQPEQQQAKALNTSVEALFDNLVQQVPPGAMGLMLQPYWSPGLKNLEAKGAIIGFGDVHTRAHIYRAILEGLAYALKDGQLQLERRQKQKITRLMVSGGGSQSDAAMQLTADIFNLPAYRPHTFETSGLGAAINAAVGLGYYSNYPQASQAMTHISECFMPNPEHVKLYHALYHKVYRQMYRRLKPIYQQIKAITGYPE